MGHEIAKRLRGVLPTRFFDVSHPDYNFSFNEVLDHLSGLSAENMKEDLDDGIDVVEMINDWLTEIYDWGDRNRVWLG